MTVAEQMNVVERDLIQNQEDLARAQAQVEANKVAGITEDRQNLLQWRRLERDKKTHKY